MEIILCIIGIVFYFIPSMVAFGRDKSSKGIILVLNILLGWTLIGWIFLLVWAFSIDTQLLQNASAGYSYYQPRNLPKKECPKCSNSIDYDYTSCPKCGEHFPQNRNENMYETINVEKWECSKCGDHNVINSIVCNGCGNYKSN